MRIPSFEKTFKGSCNSDSSTYFISGRSGFNTKYVMIIKIMDMMHAKILTRNKAFITFGILYFKS